jgi:thymidylate synthase ThyX
MKATIIADSISPSNIRLTTLELEYPRFIHSELMTHRMLSKNSSSSRAVPIHTMNEHISRNPAMPVYWGKNQAGMTAKEEIDTKEDAIWQWQHMKDLALVASEKFFGLGVHKQIANRVTEPFQIMKTIISGTEWNNFFWLRDHEDAQPEFQRLAKEISDARMHSLPNKLTPGQWHLPYIELTDNKYYSEGIEVSLEDAKIISVSCCAQVSYRKQNTSIDKAKEIYDRLIKSTPCHASPLEHQATPMGYDYSTNNFPDGMTHVDRLGRRWSGNFKEWTQLRQLTPNNYVPN